MDSFIAQFPSTADGDLVFCEHDGVAYQADMGHRVEVSYFDKCNGYFGSEIARKINVGRRDFVDRFVGSEFPVLDVGVGAGEFIIWRNHTWGYDVDEKAVSWLKSFGAWSDDFRAFRAFTFWDVLEHVETPNDYFQHMVPGTRLFASLPIFDDLSRVRGSRHYRPGEHLYYWTKDGFVAWMFLHCFQLIGLDDFETRAGRDSILTFTFERFPE